MAGTHLGLSVDDLVCWQLRSREVRIANRLRDFEHLVLTYLQCLHALSETVVSVSVSFVCTIPTS